MTFDPYHRWLGIPPEEQPPNHYRLLGVTLFEDDADVLESAADQRMAHLRTHQAGKHGKQSQKLLNEVAAARVCLLHPEKRAEYDEKLRAELGATSPKPAAKKPAKRRPALRAAAIPQTGDSQEEIVNAEVVDADVVDADVVDAKALPASSFALWFANNKPMAMIIGGSAAALLLIVVAVVAIMASRGKPVAHDPGPSNPVNQDPATDGQPTDDPANGDPANGNDPANTGNGGNTETEPKKGTKPTKRPPRKPKDRFKIVTDDEHRSMAGLMNSPDDPNAPVAPPPSLDKGLVSHYEFSSRASDRMSNYNGEIVGTAKVVEDATRGSVLGLDGGFVRLPSVFGAPANVTVAAWVYAVEDNGEVITLGDTIGFRIRGSTTRSFVRLRSAGWRDITSTKSMVGTGWRHLATTFDGFKGSHKFYIDGKLVGSATSGQPIFYSKTTALIGRHMTSSSTPFRGMIDDVRIYDRALDTREIGLLAGTNSGNIVAAPHRPSPKPPGTDVAMRPDRPPYRPPSHRPPSHHTPSHNTPSHHTPSHHTPSPPTHRPAPEPAKRLPVPSPAEQAKIMPLVVEAFELDPKKLAKAEPKEISDIARSILKEAQNSSDDATTQYVMLRKSCELAAKIGDLAAAVTAADELGRRFQANPTAMRVHLARTALKASIPPEAREKVMQVGLEVADEAIAADLYADAEKIASSLSSLASRFSDRTYTKQVAERRKLIAAKKKSFVKVAAAMDAVKANPDNPEANTTLGIHLCLRRDEWDKGLAHLAKGNSPKLKAAAALEKSNPSDAMQQLAVADGWHDAAEELPEDVKLAALDHAKDWYERCMPTLPGLHKVKAQKRLEKIAEAAEKLPKSSTIGPKFPCPGVIAFTADYRVELAINGRVVDSTSSGTICKIDHTFNSGDTLIVRARRGSNRRGFACAIQLQGQRRMIVTGARDSGWKSYRPLSTSQWYMPGGKAAGPVLPSAGPCAQAVSNVAGTQCAAIWSGVEESPTSTYSNAFFILQMPGTPPARPAMSPAIPGASRVPSRVPSSRPGFIHRP